MAGRHTARPVRDWLNHRTGRRIGRVVLILLSVLVVVAGGVAVARALRSRSHHNSAASTCTGEVSLPVIAAPTVETAIAAVASRWNASHPGVRGRCIRAVVSGRDSAVAAKSLASNTTATLWIPDAVGQRAGGCFPMVRVVPGGSDPLVAAAMAQFERQLRTTAARAELAKVGLRDPSGAPLDADSSTGISRQRVTPAPGTINPQLQATAQRLWSAAARPSQLLAVIDVSGSMAADSGNGKSKIDVVSTAAETAMTLVPDDWAVGLWTFSQHNAPQTDWTELVPIGPVKSQRRTLTRADATLPDRVGGDTALYDTALAAFRDVSAHYDPASVNVVALLTDGRDVDPDGIGLPALLSRLRAEYDPAKPVHIVTIGFGTHADANALQRISRATHGQSYLVKDPKDILGVLLDSIIANNV